MYKTKGAEKNESEQPPRRMSFPCWSPPLPPAYFPMSHGEPRLPCTCGDPSPAQRGCEEVAVLQPCCWREALRPDSNYLFRLLDRNIPRRSLAFSRSYGTTIVPVSGCKSLLTQANEPGSFKQAHNNMIITPCWLQIICIYSGFYHKTQHILGQDIWREITVFSSSRKEILLSVEETDFVPSSVAVY